MDYAPLLSISQLPRRLTDPVATNQELLQASPTCHPDQLLLTHTGMGKPQAIAISTLTTVFKEMLAALKLDSGLYTVHSLPRPSQSSGR